MKSSEYRRRLSGHKPLHNSGDTLVEVLIAIVIISMILSGAFLTSRTSLVGTRQAEERGEGLKVAESQLEELRSIGAPTAATIAPYLPFCFEPDGSPSPSFGSALPPAATDNFLGYYPGPCIVDSNGKLFAPTTIGIPYHIGIVYDNSAQLFDVHVRWDRAGGGGKDEVTLLYRLTANVSLNNNPNGGNNNPNGGNNNPNGGLGNLSGSAGGTPTEYASKNYFNDASRGYPLNGYGGKEPTTCTYNWGDGTSTIGTPAQCRSYPDAATALAAGGFIKHDYCLPSSGGSSGPGGVPCNQPPPCMTATIGHVYRISKVFTVTLTIPGFPVTITAITNLLPICK